MFPGGNTCYGFYSFYDYIVPHNARKKIVLKGGPGVGKSTFMKALAEDLNQQNQKLEYHWCSADNESLDAVVFGDQEICILDGTDPHKVDPRYPGAVDEIINLGDYWYEEKIQVNKEHIIRLTNSKSLCFSRAYIRLKECKMALNELKSYYEECTDINAVHRNVLELAEFLLQNSQTSYIQPRHLFGAAITPNGIVTKVNSLIDKDFRICAIKGSPGIGSKRLFKYTQELIELTGVYAEFFHNPFDPEDIDIIVVPHSKTAVIDISTLIVDYEKHLNGINYKRYLDFNNFIKTPIIKKYTNNIAKAESRFRSGLNEAIEFINQAKKYHDDLEAYYIPAMNFDSISILRKELHDKLLNLF